MGAVSARGLVKRYGELVAVDHLDLDAREGTCLGLLGPNGAGKTTTIEMLEGLKQPDEGEVRILDRDWRESPWHIRERIGVQLQETELQEKLTVFETLRLFRSFFGEGADPEAILAVVGLTEKRDAQIQNLSGGQKQRLTLGCALVNDPRVLFLDEPSTGLDPQARRRVWEIVEEFKGGGGTVILTTHYMEEAERLADELVVVDRGRIIAQGSPAELIAGLGAESIVEVVPARPEDLERLDESALCALAGVSGARRDGRAFALTVDDVQASLGALLAHLEALGSVAADLHTHRPTLEDVFVSLTGKHLRDGE